MQTPRYEYTWSSDEAINHDYRPSLNPQSNQESSPQGSSRGRDTRSSTGSGTSQRGSNAGSRRSSTPRSPRPRRRTESQSRIDRQYWPLQALALDFEMRPVGADSPSRSDDEATNGGSSSSASIDSQATVRRVSQSTAASSVSVEGVRRMSVQEYLNIPVGQPEETLNSDDDHEP